MNPIYRQSESKQPSYFGGGGGGIGGGGGGIGVT